MSRLIIPQDFTSQLTLLSNINQENTNLGADSPIAAFLTQQQIVLADDAEAAESAQTHETNRALLSRQSENFRQLRDNLFEKPWQHVTGSAQFLKSFYKGNTKQLGTWGFTITDSGKINYPPAFTERAEIFNALNTQNSSYAAGTSPLQPYLTQQKINLTTDAGFVDQATGNNTNFTLAAQQSENETELRNQIWLPVLAHIQTIGNFLMKLYSNNPKALGDWGFTVHDSPQKPRMRTTKLKIGEQITNKSVVIGSTVSNVGEGELHLYKGTTTTGTPQIMHKGEQFGIQKGWSSITVVNPSMLIEGRFTWSTSS
jgi:hypothetical protein